MTAKDHRAKAIHTDRMCIVSPVADDVKTSEFESLSGRSALKDCPIKRREYPPWPAGPMGRKADKTVPPGGRPLTINRRRYIVSIMKASERPIMTRRADTVIVRSA